jgi:hypothetical protein
VAEPIRYYMDQHYPAAVTAGLRRKGIDVSTAQEAERCGLPDPEQLAFATGQQRVMVSFDSDYLALHQSGVAQADSSSERGARPLLATDHESSRMLHVTQSWRFDRFRRLRQPYR